MPYRELQKECKLRGLGAVGTVSVLRERLRDATRTSSTSKVDEATRTENLNEDQQQQKAGGAMDQTDNSNIQDDEYEALLKEIMEKATMCHWKSATRKLKRLKKKKKRRSAVVVPKDVYVAVLGACIANRLQGARASEPARKVMEQMGQDGYSIPPEMGNYCLQNCLGDGPNGTHDGCGGIDCALAMMAAIEFSADGDELVSDRSYTKLVMTLAQNGAIEEALQVTKSMITEKSFTPSLSLFATVCGAAATFGAADKVTAVLGLATLSGYNLDDVASTKEGRTLLVTGLVAAEQSDNIPLGLRLLTAASKASGCEPSRGDILLASHSPTAQRAVTVLHRRAIFQAVENGDWQLAVKVHELMKERALIPSPAIWRNVIVCCARAEKSRTASSLLLEWAKLSDTGKLEKPPISLFNTVINACEVTEETAVTSSVLKAMKRIHETDGNVFTFNIVLKRLARKGDVLGCDGVITKMVETNVQPNVVSYTTAIAACVGNEEKNPTFAYEWIRRMRSSSVMPNIITYNTALAACLDGRLESTIIASKIATELYEDVEELTGEEDSSDDSGIGVTPNAYTRSLCRQVMKQLGESSKSGDIDKRVADAALQQPLLRIMESFKSEEVTNESAPPASIGHRLKGESNDDKLRRNEAQLEFAVATSQVSSMVGNTTISENG